MKKREPKDKVVEMDDLAGFPRWPKEIDDLIQEVEELEKKRLADAKTLQPGTPQDCG